MSKCYMCDQTAVGDEHVPPRCLFPKAKDLPNGVDLRKDLITVLSCADHNSEKSREDQYFLNVITSCESINEVGREHYRRQIRRQNERNPSIIARFADRTVEIDDRIAHKIEIDRLDSFVEHLAYALYFAISGIDGMEIWSGYQSFYHALQTRPQKLNTLGSPSSKKAILSSEMFRITVLTRKCSPIKFSEPRSNAR